MRVAVLGASGLLGRAVVNACVGAGHGVVAVSRSGAGAPDGVPAVRVVRADLAAADDAALDDLLRCADAVVHCLGPDDRSPLARPVPRTLDRLLVGVTERVAAAVRRSRAGHLVVLGSYFTAFDRTHPQWRLADRHPYVSARVAQAARARAAAGDVPVSVLEIPFVFGALPGVVPMWRDVFFEPLRRSPVGFALPGGSAAVRHTDVATAVLALLAGAAAPGDHPLAVADVGYGWLARVVLDELGRRVPVVRLPVPVVTAGALAAAAVVRLRGGGTGLHPFRVGRDLLARDLYLDPAVSGAALGLVPGPVEDDVRRTVRAAYPSRQGPG